MDVISRIANYKADIWPHVEGWIGDGGLAALETGCRYQEELGITGNGLEIGVYHGRFFLALCSALRAGEKCVAIDIFDNQALNVDGSGQASNLHQKFTSNLDRYAPNAADIEVYAADSMALTPADILKKGGDERYRLISIDGGHTAEHVMNDLALASEILVNGALIILDDWMSPHWPGVQEGYVRFMMNANRRLAPAFYIENKLFMTTISHQAAMTDFFAEHFKHRGDLDIRPVRSGAFRFLSAV